MHYHRLPIKLSWTCWIIPRLSLNSVVPTVRHIIIVCMWVCVGRERGGGAVDGILVCISYAYELEEGYIEYTQQNCFDAYLC